MSHKEDNTLGTTRKNELRTINDILRILDEESRFDNEGNRQETRTSDVRIQGLLCEILLELKMVNEHLAQITELSNVEDQPEHEEG